MQEKPEDYYYDGRGSLYSNGPNTFTAKDEIFPKYSTSTYTASTAAKLDEDCDAFEVPDIMGVPGRSGSANGPDRLRSSEHNGKIGRRSENIKKGGRTKSTLQKDGVNGMHKDTGCCHDQ